MAGLLPIARPGPPPGTPKPPGSGRRKGTPNKTPRLPKELRAVAQKYTARAMRELARLAEKSEDEAVRLNAIREILDRGHGRPAATSLIGGAEGAPPVGIAAFAALVADFPFPNGPPVPESED